MKKLLAKDIMTTDVITIPEDMPVAKLANLFTSKMISGAPVVDQKGHLVGVVSLSDIVMSATNPAKEKRSPHRADFYSCGWGDKLEEEERDGFNIEVEDDLQVQDIMTPVVISVTEKTSIIEMAETMLAGRVHRLIVTRNKKVVGIVTTMDMLKVIARLKEKNEESSWDIQIPQGKEL